MDLLDQYRFQYYKLSLFSFCSMLVWGELGYAEWELAASSYLPYSSLAWILRELWGQLWILNRIIGVHHLYSSLPFYPVHIMLAISSLINMSFLITFTNVILWLALSFSWLILFLLCILLADIRYVCWTQLMLIVYLGPHWLCSMLSDSFGSYCCRLWHLIWF